MKIKKGGIHLPNAHQSTALLCPFDWIISGARYSGVPHRVHVLRKNTPLFLSKYFTYVTIANTLEFHFFEKEKIVDQRYWVLSWLPFRENSLDIKCALGYGNPTEVARSNQHKHTFTTGSVGTFPLIPACHLSRVSVAQGTQKNSKMVDRPFSNDTIFQNDLIGVFLTTFVHVAEKTISFT